MEFFDNRVNLDCFKNESVYKYDYKQYNLHNIGPKDLPKSECKIIPKPFSKSPFKDNETFEKWRDNAYLNFDFLWEPRPIIDTTPYSLIPVIEPGAKDPFKEQAIETRPRIYMLPAVSLDDITEKKLRNFIINQIYTSDWKKAVEEFARARPPYLREIPKTTLEETHKIGMTIDLMPNLPKQFRNLGKKWENDQMRGDCDPTEMFWDNKEKLDNEKPDKDCELLPQKIRDEINELVETDKLRQPHDLKLRGCTIYTPMATNGVTLRKANTPVTHPYITVAQAIAKRWEEK